MTHSNQYDSDTEKDVNTDSEVSDSSSVILPPLFREIEVVLKVFSGILLIALLLSVGANVVGRFALDSPIPWTDELSRFLFTWVVFIGATLAYFRNEHVSVNYLVERLPKTLHRIIILLVNMVVASLLVTLLWGSWKFLSNFSSSSAILGIPLSWVYASLPLGTSLMMCLCLYKISCDLRALLRGE